MSFGRRLVLVYNTGRVISTLGSIGAGSYLGYSIAQRELRMDGATHSPSCSGPCLLPDMQRR